MEAMVDRIEVSIAPDGTGVPTRSLQLIGGGMTLSLRLLPSEACVETIVSLPGAAPASRGFSVIGFCVVAILVAPPAKTR